MAVILASSSEIASGGGGDVLVYLSLIVFAVVFAYCTDRIEIPRLLILLVLPIYSLFILNGFRLFSGLFELPFFYLVNVGLDDYLLYFGTISAYILASFIFLFVVPSVLDFEEFSITLSFVALASMVLGLFAYLVGSYTIGWVEVTVYTALQPLREFGIFVPAMASIFTDANAMSKVLLAGSLASLYLYVGPEREFAGWLFIINSFGLFLANSRTAMVAYVVALSVYIVASNTRTAVTRAYVLTVLTTGLLLFSVALWDIGGLSIADKVGLAHRVQLWRAALYTWSQQPVFGTGIYQINQIISLYTGVAPLGPQNSYLRIFVATGIIGGFAYLLMIGVLLFKQVHVVKTNRDAIVLAFLFAFLIIQFTDTSDPFGVNKNSMIVGAIMGYSIKRIYDTSWHPRFSPAADD